MEGPRPLKPEEFESLITLINTVFAHHVGRMKESFPLLFSHHNWPNLFVFSDKGRIVSHVGMRLDEILVLGCRIKVASIGSVATYEEYRGKSLATQCLQAAEAKAVTEGASVTLISGRRGLYDRFGAVRVGRSRVYSFAPAAAPQGLLAREAASADIFKVERIYECEPVRFHRPLEDWAALFAAIEGRYVPDFRDAVYLIGPSSGPTAYVACRFGRWDDKPFARVAEYAGNRQDVVAALPAVAAATGADALEFSVPDYDVWLKSAATATGLSSRETYLMGHTVKISCLPTFVRSIKPYIEERIGRSGAGGVAFQPGPGTTYDVIIGEEHIPFAVPSFTTLVFGSPETENLEGVGFGGGLLGRIFPMPLPLPGLNYV